MLIKSTTGKVLTDTQGRTMTTKDRWHPLVVDYAKRVIQDGGTIETPALEEMNTMAWNGYFADALFAYFACGYKAGKAYTLIGDDLTVERDSAATRWNKYGVLEEIEDDVPEMTFNPLTHEFKGLSVQNQRTLLNPNLTDFPTGQEITFSHEENIIGSEVPIRFYNYTNVDGDTTLANGTSYNWLGVTTNHDDYYSFSFLVHKGSSRYYHIRCSGAGAMQFIVDLEEGIVTDELPQGTENAVEDWDIRIERITESGLFLINLWVLRGSFFNSEPEVMSLRIGAVANSTGIGPAQTVLPDTIGLAIPSLFYDNKGLYPIVLSDDTIATRLRDYIYINTSVPMDNIVVSGEVEGKNISGSPIPFVRLFYDIRQRNISLGLNYDNGQWYFFARLQENIGVVGLIMTAPVENSSVYRFAFVVKQGEYALFLNGIEYQTFTVGNINTPNIHQGHTSDVIDFNQTSNREGIYKYLNVFENNQPKQYWLDITSL